MIPLGMLAGAAVHGGAPADASLWLDASDAATVLATDGRVRQWSDKSSNGRHATQPSSALRPFADTFHNGLPVIRFAGAHELSCGDVLDLGSNRITVWAVARYTTTGEGTVIGKSYYGNKVGRWALYRAWGKEQAYAWTTGATDSVGVAGTSTSPRLQTFTWSDGESYTKWRFNGGPWVANGAAALGSYNTADPLRIGRYDAAKIPLTGWIAEIICLSRAATPTELASVDSYLMAKWGIIA